MKKKIIASVICSLMLCVATLGFSACDAQPTKTTEYWNATEEAKTMATRLIAANDKKYLQQDYFDNVWWPQLQSRAKEAQNLPTISTTLKHTPVKTTVCENSVYTLTDDGYDKIVIYLHGGAFVGEIYAEHITFCDDLASKANAKVCMPLYPLAPQSAWYEAFYFVEEVYNSLLTENKPIYIMGDSAGGNLSLAFTQFLKANNLTLPEKLVLISPCVDFSMTNSDIAIYDQKDIELSPYGAKKAGIAWASGTDLKDYHISPLYGDLDSLPDMLIFTTDCEIVYPDIIKLYNQATNTNIKLIVGHDLWHVFPIYSIPEKATSISAIVDFL